MKNSQTRTAEKRRRQREKKKQKLADERTRCIFKYVLVIILSIVCTFSYCKQQKAMEVSDITMCKVISVYKRSLRYSKVARLEYYVSGKRYEATKSFDSRYSDGVGDCFLLKYSISDPRYCVVLWEEGKQDCDSFK